MTTLINETFDSYTGIGFAPSPVAGQLDSDLWRATGLSNGDGTFGGTFGNGSANQADFSRGVTSGGVNTGGLYALDQSGGDTAFWMQPTGGDLSPGTVTLKITNTTGATITQLDVSYTILELNDQNRSGSLNFQHSGNDGTYTSFAAADFTSTQAEAGSPSILETERSFTLTGLTIAAGAEYYLQWAVDDAGGSGNRDELGLDDIVVSASTADPVALFSDPTLTSQVSTHADLGAAQAVASSGQAIEITDPAALGDIGAFTILVDGLTVVADLPFNADFTLDGGVRNLAFFGGQNSDASGNGLANKITGSDGNNSLSGLDGNDVLEGKAGDDTLFGGEGNDKLRGGTGTNEMTGGLGNDVYTVFGSLDQITEIAGEGYDRLFAGVDYTLAAGLDIEMFAARGDNLTGLALDGNEISQQIRGAAGNDTLTGQGGDDVMRGKGGNDELDGGVGNDVLFATAGQNTLRGGADDDIYKIRTNQTVVEEAVGAGRDIVDVIGSFALAAGQEVEVLRAGSNADIELIGNEFDQSFYGKNGSDLFDGGGGNDRFITRGGSDAIIFGPNSGQDTITDFDVANDQLDFGTEGSGVTGFGDIAATDQAHGLLLEFGLDDSLFLVGLTSDDPLNILFDAPEPG